MKTSEKIVKARTAQNITQDQLAESLGVSRQTVSKWELDVSLPETSRLLKLAKLLSVSVDYLLDDEMDNPQAKLPMVEGQGGIQPDWTALFPILTSYQETVDMEKYGRKFVAIFQELMARYGYSQEDAMLVAKDILAKAYFEWVEPSA